MAYIINKFNGEQLIVLEDGTIDTSTSINLVGRNYVGYGEVQNENFVYLLENFANAAPPSRPLKGQLWFNTTNNLMNLYDGSQWNVVGAATLSDTAPTAPSAGSLWLETPTNRLNIWNGNNWSFIGPESVPGFGITRFRSGSIIDSTDVERPVIYLTIDDNIVAICAANSFTINPSNAVENFPNNIVAGINLVSGAKINGDITGRAGSADRLHTPRSINGVIFDGQTNVTIKSSTTNKHVRGNFLLGSDFDGSSEVTWSVDASSSNIIGKVVVRNSEGGFAAGTITANLVGNVTGNITSTGTSNFNIIQANQFVGATLTGNAFSATKLERSRKINGINFDGTVDIEIPQRADNLTGATLSSNVTISSLTQLGTLTQLNVSDNGVTVGSAGQFRIFADGVIPTLRSSAGEIHFDLGVSGPEIALINASKSLSLSGPNAPSLIADNITNLGIPSRKFDKVYANELKGNADTATLSTTAVNLQGGGAGAIPYQTSAGTTAMLAIGTPEYVLKAKAGNSLQWEALATEHLSKGTHINMVNTTTSGAVNFFNSSVPVTISVDAVSSNTAGKIVVRDSSGNFSAGTITANLTGTATNATNSVNATNAENATRLRTPRRINGVNFDGTADITVSDPNSGTPVGAILYYPVSSIPTGWLVCNGALLSTTAYPLLFGKIGYTYGGSGDLFRLPDLRGEFIRGADLGRGVDPDRAVGSYQQGSLITHNDDNDSFTGGVWQNMWFAQNYKKTGYDFVPLTELKSYIDGVNLQYPQQGGVYADWVDALDASRWTYMARPRNVALIACIKAFGVIDDPDQLNAGAVVASISSIPRYQITYGNTIFSTSGYTNIVNSFSDSANYFDVFPPTGKTMSNLVAFIPSIATIHYAGGVNGDDSMRCTWSNLGNRIRVYVQNTEQRSTPAANYLAIWS